MHGERLAGFLKHLRQSLRPACGGALEDAELLRRWVSRRDEAAFEVLLWRHGPLVLGVCRRVLHDRHEAEDACQATFLVLARKAGSIGKRQALAAWLYRVAYRVALLARARAARWPGTDPAALVTVAAPPGPDLAQRELHAVLDQEIGRLPEKYRLPIVLCYLQGQTNAQAAHVLGCPPGTVASRLARARERLRTRLAQRGITLPASVLAASLAAGELAAAISARLIGATVRAGALLAAGQRGTAVVSAPVYGLLEGALQSMTLAKTKLVTVVILTLGLFGAGAGTLAYHLVAGQPALAEQEAKKEPRREKAEDKAGQRPTPAQEAAAEAERQRAERAERLDEARDRLTVEQEHYRVLTRRLSQQGLGQRIEQMRLEEKLRLQEREHAADRDRAHREILRLEALLDKTQTGQDDPGWKHVHELEKKAKAAEAARTQERIELRVRLMEIEEQGQQLEREQKVQRELALARLTAAAERVRQLEFAPAPASRPRGGP